MTRVLFIARYRDPTMRRKVDYLTQTPDLEILYVTPAQWRDDLLRVTQSSGEGPYRQLAIPLRGKPVDPHRAFFQTLDFSIRTFRPQIIHAEEEPDSLSALQIAGARRLFAPGAKLLLHTWQNIDRPLSLPVAWVMNRTLAAADLIFCANQEAAAILRHRGFSRPVPVIPAIGVDTETFLPCPPQLRPAAAPPVLGYIGRFVPEKGIDTLLHAFASLHQAALPLGRLRLIGAGPQQARLETLVAALGIANAVEFVKPLAPAQIAQTLCGLDALILPSRTTPVWKEQLGRVLLEAMASGVPVIGSNSGAIPEVIGDAGLVFPEGDAGALAANMMHLLSAADLRQTCITRGIQRVNERYSQQVLAAQTIAVYRQVLS